MLVKAWNNGRFLPSGSGYGLWCSEQFRDEYLSRDWASIFFHLEGQEEPVELAINSWAFWDTGRELRSGKVGKWLIAQGCGSWEKGQEPALVVTPLEQRHFALSLEE